MTEPIPDPGWYPDPEGAPGRARYWDGAAWTDRTRELASIESAGRSDEPPPPPAAARPWWRRPLVAAAAVVLVVVVVGAFLLVSGSKEAGAEVILQPSASSGVDPFTDSVANSKVAVKNGGFEQLTADSAAVESISGAAPGLYGGTGKEAVCDPAALVAFLKHNPDKAAAFASVVGIRPKQIPDYVAGLTPVLLREDTRVTNHGFVDGQANGFDAVLEAGTAVLVDDRGVPRVRCACGNPLSEPAPTQSTPDYSGQPWDGFNDQRLVAVTPAKQQQDSFELVDVNTGQSYEQAAGSGAVTLAQDGLGIVDFGTPAAQTIKALTDALGPPDERTDLECAVGSETSGEVLRWNRLGVSVGANAGFFQWGFELGPQSSTGAPLSDSKLTTPEGLGQGMSVADFKRAYGPVAEDDSSLYVGLTTLRANPRLVGFVDSGQLQSITAASAPIEVYGVPDICSGFD